MTFPSTTATIARTDAGQTFTGGNTFSSAVTFSALTAGRIPFSGPSGLQGDSANLVWDNTNARAGVGTNASTLSGKPSGYQFLVSNTAVPNYIVSETGLNTGYAGVLIRNDSADAGTFVTTSSAFVTSGFYQAGNAYLTGQVGNLYVNANVSAKAIIFGAALYDDGFVP